MARNRDRNHLTLLNGDKPHSFKEDKENKSLSFSDKADKLKIIRTMSIKRLRNP